MPDGLLPRRRLVDGIQRQRDLNELLAGLHRAVGGFATLPLGMAPFTRPSAQGHLLLGNRECPALSLPLASSRRVD